MEKFEIAPHPDTEPRTAQLMDELDFIDVFFTNAITEMRINRITPFGAWSFWDDGSFSDFLATSEHDLRAIRNEGTDLYMLHSMNTGILNAKNLPKR